jgi:CheY-like chemotaxis protein
MNLCTNAIDATRGRAGKLTVSLTRASECPAHVGQSGPPRQGEFVRLAVTDTGDGMDAATVERVFDPFFTTKVAGKGTGLGLAVVHGIVLNHGGAMTVTSTPGAGSTFTVHLPSLGRQQDFQEEPPVTHLAGSEHVLVIDDEQAVAQVVKRLLEPYGYTVTVAGEPSDVLARIQDGETVDLLVTDYDMPLMNGLDLAHAVKTVRPGLPILLITGLGDDATPDRLKDAGVAAMIDKPFTGSDLVGQVRSVLDAAAHKER